MQRLSALDHAFLTFETPSAHMHVAMTAVFDTATVPGGYSFARVRDRIASRLHLVPQFRQRIVEVPLDLHHPIWVEDPDFDLDHHVRRVGVPAPGSLVDLSELAGRIASRPLDRSLPLWEMYVCEGMEHGRVGVIAKMHHAAIDGVSGAELMANLFDLSVEGDGDEDPPAEHRPERVPSDLELVGHALNSRLRSTVRLLPLVGETIATAADLVQRHRDPDTVVGAVPLTAPPTPWNASITPQRRVAFARVDLGEVKAVKDHFDVSVNDVVLALMGGTLRAYLEAHDALPAEPLLAVCPISVRSEDDAGVVNRVSAMFTTLATQLDDPAERLARIHETTRGAKDDHDALGAEFLTQWAEYAAPQTFALASRMYSSLGLADRHRPIHNVVISNVPGPPFPLYLAGAELVAAYPMGPVMEGAGLNITVMSYRDGIDIGFMACRELVPDVWSLPDHVETAMVELLAAIDGGTAI